MDNPSKLARMTFKHMKEVCLLMVDIYLCEIEF